MAMKLREEIAKLRKRSLSARKSGIADDDDEPTTQANSAEGYLNAQSEIRELKDQISHQSKKNFMLEKDLRFLDSKIALLISHKISIEELESKMADEPSLQMLGTFSDLHCPELYGRLFFQLQTVPEYMAKLTRLVTSQEIDGLLQTVMFTLYGNQYEDREEQLLLNMFECALMLEVREATEFNSLMRANTAITRMLTNYYRRGPGQEYVKSCLGDLIQSVISYEQSLDIDPMKIYESMIENEEISHPPDTPANVLLQAAEANLEVQRRIEERLPVLQDLVIRILERLRMTIASVPYGIRWLCKAVRALILEKFPDATNERVNSFIGGFFFLRYINPIIATPHAYQLVLNPPSHQCRRNLTLIAKMIQKLANTTSVFESYMLPMEHFVRDHSEELKVFLADLCEVEDFHEQLQLEEYIALCRKDIHINIALSEIALIHTLLLKYEKDIMAPNDELFGILRELPAPSEAMKVAQQTIVRLELIHSLGATAIPESDTSLLTVAKAPADSPEDSSVICRHCKHLLIRLLRMAPHCLQEPHINSALQTALLCAQEDVRAQADLTLKHFGTLRELTGSDEQGQQLFEEVKMNFPPQHILFQKLQLELQSLKSIHEALLAHADYLQEQLDAYKEYLNAVRAKVGELQAGSYIFKKTRGTYRFTHAQLEKEGVILESPGIPAQRRASIQYTFSCPEPGIYNIAMHRKGSQKAIYERTVHLEDLLEMQHLSDPIIEMEGFVVFNVRRTLILLNRIFMRKDSGHRPISRHFSAPTLTVNTKAT